MRHQIRAGLRIGLVGAAVLVPLAALVAAPAGAADAPADGALAVAPATGNTAAVSPLTFTAGAACPAGSTNFKVTIKGAGFAGSESDGSTNAIGVTGIDAATLTVPIAAVLGMTWDTLAQDKNAAIPLSGAAAMRLICQNGDNESLGAFVTAVTFTPADGTSTFAAAAAGGGGGGGAEATPTPTPAPTGAATPTPTPAPTGAATPTPTPAASGTPTPTQDPDASPTPSPTTTETATPTPSPTETTVVAGVNLPATGANSGPLVLFGFMLLAGGTLMIIVSSTPVPANPVKRD